jgi:hypothetical protein
MIGKFKGKTCNYDNCYYIFKSGAYYHGAVHDNKLNGKGKLKHSKFEYDGEWQNDKPHGQGVEVQNNGDKYVGPFVNGRKHGVVCEYKWSNHETIDSYKGAFALGKICGKGLLILKNGTTIDAIFD